MQPTALFRGAAAATVVALVATLCSAEAPPSASSASSAAASSPAAAEPLPRRAAGGGEAEVVHGAEDDLSLLQQPFLAPRDKAPSAEGEAEPPAPEPYLIGLRRESVPVYRRGKVASYKTSYSGVIHVGSPAQEFRVVFDTGSGHIVLPAAECQSEACLVAGRRKFDMHASSTALPINENGAVVPTGEACDQVTIGFGTGEITGEFTRDRVCFGGPGHAGAHEVGEVEAEEPTDSSALATNTTQGVEVEELCVEMSVILAVEMSSQPFKTFNFDGILGLGLDALALNSNFSAFSMLLGRGLPTGHFGVFLTEGEEGEESEIAIGAADSRRMLEPLHWAPVMMPEHGHWQVQILSIRIGGETLDICRDGTCRGVVDTGTSHLGIPAPADAEVANLLTTEAGDILDCRVVEAPEVEIELPGYTLTLRPHNYMRRLPLREGVSVSSVNGVQAKAPDAAASATAPAADAAGAGAAAAAAASAPEAPANVAAVSTAEQEEAVRRFCRPRLMPVRLPAPLGPKLFILGEPVLHRYYTVYDWENKRVGFSLANSRRNTMSAAELVGDGRGALPKEVDVLLMQQRVTIARAAGGGNAAALAGDGDQLDAVAARAMEEGLPEATILMQVELKISVRRRVL